MRDQFPLLSIVIPAMNEERFIAETIGYLLNQDYPPEKVEILAVIADSRDRTAEVVQHIAAGEHRVKYLRNPYGLSSGARTIGVQNCSGDIIIFVDGHVYIDSNRLFLNTVRLMEEKQVSVLSRPQLLDTPNNSHFQRAVSLARSSWIGHGRDSTIYSRKEEYVDPGSSGASYKKEVFEKVGYFDLAFDACEDVDFNYRCAKAGYRSFTSMDLAVYYYPRSSLKALFRQMVRYGAGRFRLARKHPQTLALSTLFPTLLIVAPLVLSLLSLIWPVFLFPLAGFVIFYFGLILLYSILLAGRHGWNYVFALPAVYVALHAGLGWGFLWELICSPFRSEGRKAASKRVDSAAS